MANVTQCDYCGTTSTDAKQWWQLFPPDGLIGFVGNRNDFCSNACVKAWVNKEAWDGRDLKDSD